MEHLNQLIGENLKRVRSERGMSLDAVARATGVSKSMLGQIERGEVNPTISTLWRIADGMKVSFTTLVTAPQDDFEVVLRGEREPLTEDSGKVRNFPVFPFDAERSFEMYALEIDGGGRLEAEAHTAGTQEFITVHTGTLTVSTCDEQHRLTPGDSIRFRADAPHAYENPGEDTASLSMVICYPRSS